MPDSPPELIVVLGMHRSGTSIATGMLEKLGGNVGLHPMPAAPENPDGFWENEEVVLLNEAFLDRVRSCWADPHLLPDDIWDSEVTGKFRKKARKLLKNEFGKNDLVLIKDPRMCRVFPLWEPVFRERFNQIACVIVSRPFPETAISLSRRNEFSPFLSTLLWLQHVLLAERYSRPFPSFFTSFTRITGDPSQLASSLANFITIDDLPAIEKAAEMVKPQLRTRSDGENLAWLCEGNPAFDTAFQLDSTLHDDDKRPSAEVIGEATQRFDALLSQIPTDLRGTYETLSIPIRRKNTQLKEELASLRSGRS